MTRWMQLMVASAVAVAVACGSDVSAPVDGLPSTTKGANGGNDTSKGGGGNPGQGGGGQTANGPVASVTIDSPTVITLPRGFYGRVRATARNAGGQRVARPVSWRSSDTSITVVTDTGIVYAVAVGTAKIFATVDGHSDSATVTVIPAPPPPPPPPPVQGVAEFTMTVVAMGAIPGTDTSRTERIAGATVTLMRIGGISDSLATPVPAGSAVTNASGEARFTKLAGGSYSIRVTPPASSAYAETLTGIGPPTLNDISVHVTLGRK
jgi:hypothetical protein